MNQLIFRSLLPLLVFGASLCSFGQEVGVDELKLQFHHELGKNKGSFTLAIQKSRGWERRHSLHGHSVKNYLRSGEMKKPVLLINKSSHVNPLIPKFGSILSFQSLNP